MTVVDRADDLERIIKELDTLWELGEPCVHPDTGNLVTNTEYDDMRRELKKLRPKSSIFDDVSASTNNAPVKKVKHHPPLTSVEKASHEDLDEQKKMLFKWMADCAKGTPSVRGADQWVVKEEQYQNADLSYPKGFFYESYKLDGVALALYYKDGQLVQAGLRPRNGVDGEDVTEQVKFVDSIPQKLKLPVTCSIRGELICKLKDFEKVQKELSSAGEKLRANPRNHTAGGIRQFKEPSKVKKMRLSFIAYGIEGLAKPPYKTETERADFCRNKLGVEFVEVFPFNFSYLAKMENNVPNLDYEVDGVIVGVDNLEDQEQLGRHGDRTNGNPKGKIAWKFREEFADKSADKILWQANRTGKITPVAEFNTPAPLAGTNVSRVTLHNLGFMIRNGITTGTVLRVIKAGKIIPKVIDVVSHKGKIVPPSKCPSCHGDTDVEHTPGTATREEMHELVCNNPHCPAKHVQGFCHYLATFGVLGLGDSKVTALVDNGAIANWSDFYTLDVATAMSCGLSERQALLAIASIHMISAPEKIKDDKELEKAIEKAQKHKKKLLLAKLLASFGMEGAGKSAGKALVEHFGSLDAILDASVADLETVQDVGTKTAQVIFDFLKDNKQQIQSLLQYVEPELPKTGKLSGLTFCFSGGFDEGKSHWEQVCENAGGKCASGVSSKVKYLVAGEGSGSKSDRAKELGIKILSIDDFKKMV